MYIKSYLLCIRDMLTCYTNLQYVHILTYENVKVGAVCDISAGAVWVREYDAPRTILLILSLAEPETLAFITNQTFHGTVHFAADSTRGKLTRVQQGTSWRNDHIVFSLTGNRSSKYTTSHDCCDCCPVGKTVPMFPLTPHRGVVVWHVTSKLHKSSNKLYINNH